MVAMVPSEPDDANDSDAEHAVDRLKAEGSPKGGRPWAFDPGPQIRRDFRLLRFLGAGRWGDVWLVRHRATGHPFAVKRLHTRIDSLDLQYLDELEAWTSLGPLKNIVQCYFWQSTRDGVPLIFSRYARNGTFGQQIAGGAYKSYDDVVQVAIALGDALTMVHERGVFHGDLSPNNILLDVPGQPLLADFGQSRLTVSPSLPLGGTPAFSPCGRCDSSQSPTAVDLWSYGLLLLHLLAGRCFWQLGGLAPLVVQRLEPYLQSTSRTSPSWHALVSVATRCFDPSSTLSARDVTTILRDMARANRVDVAPAPVAPRSAHSSTSRRVGDIEFDDPDIWLTKARTRFGPDAVRHIIPPPPFRHRRAMLIATERILAQILPLYQHHHDLPSRCEYLRLLSQVSLVRQALGSHADASLMLIQIAVLSRRWETQSVDMLRYRAMALQELAHIRILSGQLLAASLRLYDVVIWLLQRWKRASEDRDPQALLPHAFLLKADVLRFLQRFDESRRSCKQALRLISERHCNDTPDELEVIAYAYKVHARTFPLGHAGRTGLNRRAREIYARLCEQGHAHYAERIALIDFEQLRGRLRHEDIDDQWNTLKSLIRIFAALCEKDHRAERTVHLARAYMHAARLMCRRDKVEQGVKSAQRAIRIMQRGIAFGQPDLIHECAIMNDWLSHLLKLQDLPQQALRHARRAESLWKHLVHIYGYSQYARLLDAIQLFRCQLQAERRLVE